VLLAGALVATAFAHKVPNASEARLQAYALAGGDISSICAETGSGDTQSHADCLACHIIGSAVLLGAPQSPIQANFVVVATLAPPQERRATHAALNVAHGARAPPIG